jgi:hypothetical protein
VPSHGWHFYPYGNLAARLIIGRLFLIQVSAKSIIVGAGVTNAARLLTRQVAARHLPNDEALAFCECFFGGGPGGRGPAAVAPEEFLPPPEFTD